MDARGAEFPEVDEGGSLAGLMAQLADHDPAALVGMIDRHGHRIAAALSRIAADRGATLDRDDLDELVVDAVLALGLVAGSWRPDGGALPWTWAHHQMAAVVDGHLGQFTDPLDEAATMQEPDGRWTAGAEPAVLELAARLAGRDPHVALLVEALEQVASERDRAVFLETALQASLGDRAPAVTVGALHDMAPAAVRQQHRRVRLRVQQLAATDPRFAPLAALALVA